MSLKGISPLVAVVMLIAFTLLVAGILGGLVTQFAQEQRAVVQYCTGARVILLSGVASGSSVILNIHNFGDVDLTFNLLQTYKNETVRKVNITKKIPTQDVGQMTIPNANLANTKEFTIQSQECAGAQDFIRGADIK